MQGRVTHQATPTLKQTPSLDPALAFNLHLVDVSASSRRVAGHLLTRTSSNSKQRNCKLEEMASMLRAYKFVSSLLFFHVFFFDSEITYLQCTHPTASDGGAERNSRRALRRRRRDRPAGYRETRTEPRRALAVLSAFLPICLLIGNNRKQFARTARITFYGGALFGPIMTKWYQALNKLKFSSPARAVATRVRPSAVISFRENKLIRNGYRYGSTRQSSHQACTTYIIDIWLN